MSGLWNYRQVIKKTTFKTIVDGKEKEQSEIMTGIHEVHYDKDGNIVSWTANPVDVSSYNNSVRDILNKMLLSLDKPTLAIVVDSTGKESLVDYSSKK